MTDEKKPRRKIVFRKRPPVPIEGPIGPRGADGTDGTDGTDGLHGADGKEGQRGGVGPTGPPGAKKFTDLTDAPSELTPLQFVATNASGTKLELVPPPRTVVGGGGGGMRGAVGPKGDPGLDAGESVPKSASLTRDPNGSVQSVTVEGEAAWVISRNPDGSVAGLTNGTHDVAVDRDEDGAVSGTTVTES
jgi:hypothetical protein